MERRTVLKLLLLLSTAVSVQSLNEGLSLRGIHPEAAAMYRTAIGAGSFKCLDGLRIIAAAAINDDYCDCKDGSDEPGSSACAGGTFYCRNRGHKARNLSSTFVDDGVCDCCDGTDEPAGLCNSTCLVEGAAAREELQAVAKAATAGSKVRAQRVKAAKAERRSIQSKLQSLKSQIAEARPEVDKLAARKEAAEKVAKRLREQHDAAEAAAKKSRLASEEAQGPVADSGSGVLPPGRVDGEGGAVEGGAPAEGPSSDLSGALETAEAPAPGQTEAVQSEAIADQAAEANPDEAVAKPKAVAKTDEERAKATMAQWVKHDAPPALGEEAAGPNAGDEEPYEGDPDAFPDDEEGLPSDTSTDTAVQDEAGSTEAVIQSKPANAFQRAAQWASALLKKTPRLVAPSELERSEKAASGASKKHQERNDELQELVRKQQELETKAALDYGPDDVFLPLNGKCYATKVDKYVYEACPFGAAAQKEGGSSTRLGSFKRFEDDFTSMVFDNGQSCWQGPNRSLKLVMMCGTDEVLSAVSEPSRCVYSARLATPSLCTVEALLRLQAEVEAAQADLKEAKHDEL